MGVGWEVSFPKENSVPCAFPESSCPTSLSSSKQDLPTSCQRLRVCEYPEMACLSVLAICYLHLLQLQTIPDPEARRGWRQALALTHSNQKLLQALQHPASLWPICLL